MSKTRKILYTLFALIAAAAALHGVADDIAETYAGKALTRALVTFAAARTLNGVISVAQSTEVGVGVTVSVGQILDPINDLVEQFSSVMLVASSSLGLQTVLLNITGSRAVTATMVIATVLSIAVIWSPGLAANKFAASASRFFLIMLLARFMVPLVIIGTNLISDAFLVPDQEIATAALEGASSNIEELQEEATPPPVTEQSMMDRLSSAIDDSIASINVSERLSRLKENASNATEHIIDLIVLFVLQTIILPLAFFWLFVQVIKGIGARLTDVSRVSS